MRAVLRWATMAGDGIGGALLDRNPCAGYPFPSELSPRRPRMPEERFQAMLAVAREVHLEFALALVLAVLARYQTPDPVSMRRALASRNDGQPAAETERARPASSPSAKPA